MRHSSGNLALLPLSLPILSGPIRPDKGGAMNMEEAPKRRIDPSEAGIRAKLRNVYCPFPALINALGVEAFGTIIG